MIIRSNMIINRGVYPKVILSFLVLLFVTVWVNDYHIAYALTVNREQFVADFSGSTRDWSLEGLWVFEDGSLVNDLKDFSLYTGLGDVVLKGRVWTNPEIESEFSVQKYGPYGGLAIMWGWVEKSKGYALIFRENETVLYRYEGDSGGVTTLGRSNFKAEVDKKYQLHLVVNGANYEAFVNGEKILTAFDPAWKYMSGHVGVIACNFINVSVHSWSVIGEMEYLTLNREEPLEPPSGVSGSEPLITGTFLQLDNTTASWSRAQWRREFDAMQKSGFDTLIVQATAYRNAVFYQSEALSSTQMLGGGTIVGTLLDEAAAHGMVVWLGTYNDGGWASRIDENIKISKQVIDELAVKYGDHPAFVGWYIPNEVQMSDRIGVNPSWVRLLTTLIEYARSKTPEKPVAIAPALRVSAWSQPSKAVTLWENFLRETNPDVIMLQDGMGDHAWRRKGLSVEELVEELIPYYQAMQIAAARVGVGFWNDLENFEIVTWQPADIERVLGQLKALSPYVEKTVIFEFNHYMSPVREEPPLLIQRLILGLIQKLLPAEYSKSFAKQQYDGYATYLDDYKK